MQEWPKNIFVSGIGTGVGKTVVSAVLSQALQADYWKPIQCGNLESSDSVEVASLISNSRTKIHAEAYRLATASSPHYAAKVEGVSIDTRNCKIPATQNNLVIEGAGGLMVPINENQSVVDLISVLNIPLVLVCRNYLGSINHTLLSLSLLKERNIPIAGLIYSGNNFLDNESVIEHFSKVPVLGHVDEAKIVDKTFVEQQAGKLYQSLAKYFLL